MLDTLRKKISPDNPIRLVWHQLKGVLAACRYGFPAKGMTVIGVTGTDGKTTTCHMIESILRASGKKVAMLSTVEFRLDGKIIPNLSKKTTLSPFKTQAFLKRARRHGCEYGVIESSSHALHQSRLWGIPFKVAVLTNLTHEHLDYHGTMEKYRDAKMILFKNTAKNGGTMVLNTGDPYYQDFAKIPCPKEIRYGLEWGDLTAKDITYSKYGSHFALHYMNDVIGVVLKVPGAYNIENALAAAGAGLAVKCSLDDVKRGLESFESVPGRMEIIKSPKGFEVVVDFGLTPNALLKLYSTIKSTAPARVIGIIGSCGDRDKEKRPLLGKIVAEHADVTIVTDEEPYSEDPLKVMQAVLRGAKEVKKMGPELHLIEDRHEAIEFAIKNAQPGDTIVVTGMGNFTTRNLNSGPVPWDEREVVRTLIHQHSK